MATIIRETPHGRVFEQARWVRSSAVPVYRAIYFALDVVEVILVFRFMFRLLGVSSASGFAQFVYQLSTPLVTPFFGILRQSVTPSGAVFEWATIVAMLMYALLAYALVRLFALVLTGNDDNAL